MSDEHDSHHVNYTAIFGVLCVLTVLSIIADLTKSRLGAVALASVVMGVAVFKATCVLLYFMHIRFEGPWKYILLAPTTVLAMALPFTLAPDISFHYYTVQVPQTLEVYPSEEDVQGPGGHGIGGHAPDPDKPLPGDAGDQRGQEAREEPHGKAGHGHKDGHDHKGGGHDHKESKTPPKEPADKK
jgi:cytochrome c oxidase subunit 4